MWGLNAAVETGHLDPSDAPCYVTVTICARCVAVCYTRVSAEQSARGTRECACRAEQHPASCPKTDARAGSAQLGWSELSGTYFLCDCVRLAIPAGWCRMQPGWVWICVWRVDTVPVSSTLLLLLCIPNGYVAHYCPVLQSPGACVPPYSWAGWVLSSLSSRDTETFQLSILKCFQKLCDFWTRCDKNSTEDFHLFDFCV